jgi:hypothetical protein
MYNMSGLIAHLPAQVARHIGMPLTFIAPTGGDTPMRLRGRLRGRKVVVWTAISRMLVSDDWPVLPAPAGPSRQQHEQD